MRPLTTLRSTLRRTASLALAATLSIGLAGCGNDDAGPVSAGTASDQPTAGAPAASTPPTEASTSTETSTEAPGTVVVPLYFTGDTPLGPRLYREFRAVESDNPLEEAAALVVAGDATDPDYGTLLVGVKIESVTQEEGAIRVTLGEDSPLTATKGTSPEDAAIAVQSLVYTLQGVAQTRDPVVVVLSNGSPADLFGQPTGEGVKAAKQLDVLALVNITTPEEGATASATLSVEGVASSFEATVPYAVLDSTGTEVVSDFATAEGWVDKLYPFTAEVDISTLEPGTYTFVARTDDPSGGEGPGAFEDTKTFTVE